MRAWQILMTAGLLIGGMALPVSAAKKDAAEDKPAPEAKPAARVFQINDTVVSRNQTIRMRDLISNPAILSDEEADYEMMKTPTQRDVNMSLVDIAYLLQRYPSLVTARIRGPRYVVIKHVSDMRYVDLAKKQMLHYLRNNPPWKGWELDLAFTASDEVIINRAGAFKRLEVMPYDNTNMIGPVGFRISLYDENDHLMTKLNINPVVLRKMEAMVLRENRGIGHIIRSSDLKHSPVWVGGEKKAYITNEKDCVGKELAREVTAGELLRSSDLLNPVCAKRGQMIWVACRSGALSVTLAVLAMENGRLGDTIKVQNRSSNKEFSVELTGSKQGLYRLGS